MSETKATLANMLELTREDEVDCDAFAQHLAALAEGAVEPELRALLEHHQAICPECAEELEALARALAPSASGHRGETT